jgi:hypothetical protein
MNRVDKIAGAAFKVALVTFVMVSFFRTSFRPDIYRSVSVPLGYCLFILLFYIGARWIMIRLNISQGGISKLRPKDYLKIFGTLVALILFFGSLEYSFRNSSIAQQAIADLQTSKEGKNELGDPIRVGWIISGEMNISGGDGGAVLSIPVKGSKTAGELDVKGIRKDGSWKIEDAYLIVDGNKSIVQIPH